MTTVLLGTTAAGMISTATCFASCFEQWKNFGSTSARFASVMTFASWTMLVRAQPPVPQRLHHLGEPGDEPGRHLPVVGRTAGELQLPEQVVEEVGEAEPPVRPGPVELREGDEEVGEGDVLAAEKVGETAGGFAGL